MNNEVIVFKNLDGSCGIMIPADEELEILSIEEIAEKDVPLGLEWRITERENIPTDRTFRNAWTDDNPTETVDIDMDKACEIHMNKLRALRKPILDALDKEYMKADESGDFTKKSEIASKKQALRDIPQTLDLTIAETPEELKAIIPEELQ